MTKAQASLIAAELANAGDGKPGNRTEFRTVYTNKEAAALMKVSEDSVDKAKSLLAKADDSLKELAKAPGSKLSLDAATCWNNLPIPNSNSRMF